jgi:CubicO group peptidase (beta-lactamase class C family)
MNKLSLFILLTVILFSNSIIVAQSLPRSAPEKAGMSSERLDRIKPLMQKYVDEGKLPGVLTMVARNGKIVHLETVGKRDVAEDKPLTEDAIFRIYSMSKPVTSVAVMMLYEDGLFRLDDPVSKFIPEFENLKVFKNKTNDIIEVDDVKKEMTIRHLLTHTSGLIYGWNDRPVDTLYAEAKIFEKGTTLKQMIQKLADIPLMFQPGSEFEYSVSVDVLGYLVEVISGMPFTQFLEERIFKPLKMNDTGFEVPEDKRGRYAELYFHNQEEEKMVAAEESPLGDGEYKFFPSGGGGLVSTADDYMRFCQMMLNNGELDGARILGKKTVELIRLNHLPDGVQMWGSDAVGFGLGYSVILDMAKTGSLNSEGTYEWGGAAATKFWIDPEENLIAILMTQLMGNPYPFQEEFRVLTYSSITE